MKRRHATGVLVASVLVAAACGQSPDAADSESVEQAESGAEREGVVSALGPSGQLTLNDDSFPEPLVSEDEILDGGPGPDGIPPIDEPRFLGVDEVDFLEDNEPVVSFTNDGDARAYPIQILTWHEIVNDTVGGTPVAVTFCPLCNSAFVFDRRFADDVLSFGTSGKLWQSSLVMYDRQTRSLWSHFTGEGIAGVFAGEELTKLPTTITSWKDFADQNPDGLVLSRDTGATRQYGNNPYPGYDDVDTPPFAFDGETDDRAAAKLRVVGVEGPADGSVALTLDHLMEEKVVYFDVDGVDMVATWKPGTASGLEGFEVSEGRDVGTVEVFVSNGSDDGLDAGQIADAGLEPVVHVDTFWFAWAVFQPETDLIGST